MLPKFGVGSVGKSLEPVAGTLWDLGPNLFGLHMGLDSLGIVFLNLLQALLFVLLGKASVL
jgi:hypothetical protein